MAIIEPWPDQREVGTVPVLPMQTDETRVEVIQADRDAAAILLDIYGAPNYASLCRKGESVCDGLGAVQVFARHRLAFAAPPAVEREEIGHRMHGMHETVSEDTDRAKEMLAIAMEPQFPVEAEMARKGLHFMLPSSWAVEAIDAALNSPTLHPSDREEGVASVIADLRSLVADARSLERQHQMRRLREPECLRIEAAINILALSGSLAPANPTEKGE